MKRFLFSLFAIAIGMLSISCSNDKDDDENEAPSSEVVLNVNTASLMSFNHLGDILSDLKMNAPTDDVVQTQYGYRLRVRNLAYDKRGKLVSDEYTLQSSIYNNVSYNLSLPKGTYTVMTIADVVRINRSGEINFAFWNVSDSTNLSTVKIENTGYTSIRNLIGGAITEVKADGKNQTYTINTQPLGTLIFEFYTDIHSNSSIYSIELSTRKVVNNIGVKNNIFETDCRRSGDYLWRYSNIDIRDYSDYDNVYGWDFAAASDDTEVGFKCTDVDDESWVVNKATKNFKAGELIIAYCAMSLIYKEEQSGFILTADEYLNTVNNVSKYRTLKQQKTAAYKYDFQKILNVKNDSPQASLSFKSIAKKTMR